MNKFKIASFALFISLPHPVLADHFCSGTIEDVWIHNSGATFIKGSWAGHTQICDINDEWKGVATEICSAWLSLAQVAWATSETVIVRYSQNDITSCSTIPSYGSAPEPYYILLDK